MEQASPDDDGSVDERGLERLLGYALRRASAAMMADFGEALADHEIRPTQYAALLLIRDNPGIRASEVGHALAVKRANIAPLLGDLVMRGLVDRSPSANDRRAHPLRLSDRGEALMPVLADRVARHEAGFASRLSPAETDLLLDLLGKLWRMGDETPPLPTSPPGATVAVKK